MRKFERVSFVRIIIKFHFFNGNYFPDFFSGISVRWCKCFQNASVFKTNTGETFYLMLDEGVTVNYESDSFFKRDFTEHGEDMFIHGRKHMNLSFCAVRLGNLRFQSISMKSEEVIRVMALDVSTFKRNPRDQSWGYTPSMFPFGHLKFYSEPTSDVFTMVYGKKMMYTVLVGLNDAESGVAYEKWKSDKYLKEYLKALKCSVGFIEIKKDWMLEKRKEN